MKKFLPPLILSFLLYLAGCGNNSVTNPTTSNVTFAISQGPGTTGIIFYGKPSVDVHLSKVIAILTSANFADTITNNTPNYVFSKDTSYEVGEFNGVQSGQKWNFNFAGTTVSGSTAYNVTSNYTVP